MYTYKRVIEIIDANLIHCLIPIILTLVLVELITKNAFETKKALNCIRWSIVVYTLVTFSIYLYGMLKNPNEYAFLNRATGPYAIVYWMMFLGASILPITLIFKKLGSKFWYNLVVAFAMKSGMYFERFIIIITSFHRDYLPLNKTFIYENRAIEFVFLILFQIGTVFLQGMLIAFFVLGVFEIKKIKRPS